MRRPLQPGQPIPPSGGVGQAAAAGRPATPVKAAKLSKPAKPAKPPKSAKPPTTPKLPTGSPMAARRSQRLQAKRDLSEAKGKLSAARRAQKAFERNELRRFTAHTRRRRFAWFAGGTAALLLTIFVSVGVFSPVMALQEVVVTGTTLVNSQAIIDGVQSQMNRPLPLVDMRVVDAAVNREPLVKTYSVEALPPHTLKINIVERQAVGYLPNPDGFTIVDPAGVVITRTATKPEGLPLFTVEGDSTDAPGFQAGVDVLNSLPNSLYGQVARVIATSQDNVSLVLADSGATVFWGSSENAALKSRVLAALLAANPVGTVSVYDVSSPSTAVVR